MDAISGFEKQWGIHSCDPHMLNSSNDVIQLCKNILKSDLLNYNDTQECFQEYIKEVILEVNTARSSSDFDSEFDNVVRINRLLELIYYSWKLSLSQCRISEIMDLNKDYRDNLDASLFRFRPLNFDNNTPYQNFLLFIMNVFYTHKYARYKGDVYKSIYTKDGYNTCAWEKVDTISNTIYNAVNKDTNFDQFLNITYKGNMVNQATEFLSKCCDSQFPDLTKNRHTFSFKNGIYIAKFTGENGVISDKFIPYNSEVSSLTSSKYFDLQFDTSEAEWRNITTPFFDSIFKYQDIESDVIEWIYALTGRLLYEIDDMDGWQVIPFFQGQAGTGKSTYILNVCKQFYDDEDVGIMSNNIQKTFGLSDLVDRKLYIAPEIKRDFNIEQGEFQSIISGDKVAINIKYKQSRFESWVIPGVLAGNECPDFIDNAGSIQRRIVTVKFKNKVPKGDMQLGRKLRGEMAHILRKCNLAYHEMSSKFGSTNIWNNLPKYFLDTQDELAQVTNPLIHFLCSGKLCFDKDAYIPEKEFTALFNEHCSENNYSRSRFNSDFYIGPFSQKQITVVKKETKRYPFTNGRNVTGTFFFGVDVIKELYDQEFDDV
jgi:hypothetical protein